jgi:phosphatidylserine decarboxylase
MNDQQKVPPTTLGIKWEWPTIHPEGRKFAVISGGICALFIVLPGWSILAWLMAALTIWICAFFRDPVRSVPQDEKLIIAPADGMVCLIQDVMPPPELAGVDGLGSNLMTRVSIFMSVFDVHINRAPIAGTIRSMAYIPGKFVNADLDKASEDNERQHFMVERSDGVRIGFTQIAGLVARRILPFVKVGDMVSVGQRVGLIRFGSRVDVYLPVGTAPQVSLGQRCVAGETILATMGDGIAITSARQ